jgi:predicted RNA-binding Zn-ribbon protein involved in translation (DUF1610 family)
MSRISVANTMHFFRISCFCTNCGSKHERCEDSAELTVSCDVCGIELLELKALPIRGFVYVLVNPSIPDLFKVGMTERSPEERAREVSVGTGVPTPFEVLAAVPSGNPAEDERSVHAVLSEARVGDDREFFKGEAIQIIQAVEKATGFPAKRYGRFKETSPLSALTRTTIWAQLGSQRIRATHHGKNNFACPECSRPMTPANSKLKAHGIFRTCRDCSFHVDEGGFEVVLLRR